jgi:hypothetical protein
VTAIDGANDRATHRGSNNSQIDDCCVAKAWVQASKNSVIGTEQTGDQFFIGADFGLAPCNRWDKLIGAKFHGSKFLHLPVNKSHVAKRNSSLTTPVEMLLR